MFCCTEDTLCSILHWLLFMDRHKRWFYKLCHYQELTITERIDHQNWTPTVFHHLKPDGSDDSSAVFGSRWIEFISTNINISSVSVNQGAPFVWNQEIAIQRVIHLILQHMTKTEQVKTALTPPISLCGLLKEIVGD